MASTPTQPPNASQASIPLTPAELAPALKVDIYDREGNTKPLGELINGKRTVLIFTRHFCKRITYINSSTPLTCPQGA
jgi:hypothetical protein